MLYGYGQFFAIIGIIHVFSIVLMSLASFAIHPGLGFQLYSFEKIQLIFLFIGLFLTAEDFKRDNYNPVTFINNLIYANSRSYPILIFFSFLPIVAYGINPVHIVELIIYSFLYVKTNNVKLF
jgi:hypothetical protein